MAGYPEAHPDVIVSDPEEMDKAYWNDVHYLKEKVLQDPLHTYVSSAADAQGLMRVACADGCGRRGGDHAAVL